MQSELSGLSLDTDSFVHNALNASGKLIAIKNGAMIRFTLK